MEPISPSSNRISNIVSSPMKDKLELNEDIDNINQNQNLFVTDEGKIVQSTRISNIWEKTKSWFGGIDHTDEELVRARVDNVIHQGIENKWITFHDKAEIKAIAERFKLDIPELDKLYLSTEEAVRLVKADLKQILKIWTQNARGLRNNLDRLQLILVQLGGRNENIEALIREAQAQASNAEATVEKLEFLLGEKNVSA